MDGFSWFLGLLTLRRCEGRDVFSSSRVVLKNVSFTVLLHAGSTVRTCTRGSHVDMELLRLLLVSTVQPLTLTPVDQTARFLTPDAVQRAAWAAVPHWLRDTFTDGPCLNAQPQDWRPLLCELHSGGLSPPPKLAEEIGIVVHGLQLVFWTTMFFWFLVLSRWMTQFFVEVERRSAQRCLPWSRMSLLAYLGNPCCVSSSSRCHGWVAEAGMDSATSGPSCCYSSGSGCGCGSPSLTQVRTVCGWRIPVRCFFAGSDGAT